MRPHKPGPGWHQVAGPVYEYGQSGARLHMLGTLRLPNGDHISTSQHSEARRSWLLVAANGGNRKRGLMAWARDVLQRESANQLKR